MKIAYNITFWLEVEQDNVETESPLVKQLLDKLKAEYKVSDLEVIDCQEVE